MNAAAQALRAIMAEAGPQLQQLAGDNVTAPAPPGEWSAKEILGHLIDSAANNHQRMVRALYNEAANFPPYRQSDWVRVQHYNQRPWAELVDFWLAYNQHLGAVIDTIPPEALSALCHIGQDEPVTLEFVVNDYLRHVRHHLHDLLWLRREYGEARQVFVNLPGFFCGLPSVVLAGGRWHMTNVTPNW